MTVKYTMASLEVDELESFSASDAATGTPTGGTRNYLTPLEPSVLVDSCGFFEDFENNF